MAVEPETCWRCGRMDAPWTGQLGKSVCDWCWTEEDEEAEEVQD